MSNFPIDQKGDSSSSNSHMPKGELEENDETVLAEEHVRRAQIKIQFHGLRKGDDQTVEAYVQQLRSIADSLAEVGSPMSDSDMVFQLLAGLPSSKYLPLQHTISSRVPLPTFSEACSMLSMQERILMQEAEQTTWARPPEQARAEQDYTSLFTIETVEKITAAVSAVSIVASAGWKIWQAIVRK